MVVPRNLQAVSRRALGTPRKLFADALPVVGGIDTLLLRYEGWDHVGRTQRLRDLDEAVRLGDQPLQWHMKSETGKACIIDLPPEQRGIAFIGRQPRLDRIIAQGLQQGKLRMKRWEIPR